MDMSLSELRELVMDREGWRAEIHGVSKNWTRLSDSTELNISIQLLQESSEMDYMFFYVISKSLMDFDCT